MLFVAGGVGLLRLVSFLQHPLTRLETRLDHWEPSELNIAYTYRVPTEFSFRNHNLEHSLLEKDVSPLPLFFPAPKPVAVIPLERAALQPRPPPQPICSLMDWVPMYTALDSASANISGLVTVDTADNDVLAMCQIAPNAHVSSQRDYSALVWTQLALAVATAVFVASVCKIVVFIARQLLVQHLSSDAQDGCSIGRVVSRPRPSSRRSTFGELIGLFTSFRSSILDTVESFKPQVAFFLLPLANNVLELTEYLRNSQFVFCSSVLAELVLYPVIMFAVLVSLRTIVVILSAIGSYVYSQFTAAQVSAPTPTSTSSLDIRADQTKHTSHITITKPVGENLMIEMNIQDSLSGGDGEVAASANGVDDQKDLIDVVVEEDAQVEEHVVEEIVNVEVVVIGTVVEEELISEPERVEVEEQVEKVAGDDEDCVVEETVNTEVVVVATVVEEAEVSEPERVEDEEQVENTLVEEQGVAEMGTPSPVVEVTIVDVEVVAATEDVEKEEQKTTSVVAEEVIAKAPVTLSLNANATQFVPSTIKPLAFFAPKPEGSSAIEVVEAPLSRSARRAKEWQERCARRAAIEAGEEVGDWVKPEVKELSPEEREEKERRCQQNAPVTLLPPFPDTRRGRNNAQIYWARVNAEKALAKRQAAEAAAAAATTN